MRKIEPRAGQGSTRRLFLSAFGSLMVTAACGSAPTGASARRSPAAARRPRADLYQCEGCEGAGWEGIYKAGPGRGVAG
jgi:hypothetical protein